MTVRPYAEAEYVAARRQVVAEVLACHVPGCTNRATTVDHVPALADHRHTPGAHCCDLRPACAPCNYGAGAHLGNRRRRTLGAAHLRPGTGWSHRGR